MKRVNGYHRPLRNSVNDSPSRQLLEDLGRMLINDERNFRSSLDEQTAVQHRLHVEALDRALAKHESVRVSAERARERVELELEQERQRRDEEERKAVEKARRDLEEQRLKEEKRVLEEQAREAERKRQESLKREQDEAKRKADAQRQQEEEAKAQKERQKKEEADQKARQEAEAKQRAQQAENERQAALSQAPPQVPQTNGTGIARPTLATDQPAPRPSAQALGNLPEGVVSTAQQREAEHQAYLGLHQRLKQMRKHVSEEVKKTPRLKDQLSEWRRTVNKCVGQLSQGTTQEVKSSNSRAVCPTPGCHRIHT